MAPNNFDKKIQQQFNSRKIEPSAQSWDRLDAMLTVAENKKQPKKFFWLNIAASFLVMSGIGFVFFQENQKTEISQPKNDIVVTKETPISEVENLYDSEKIITSETQNELAIAAPKRTYTTSKKNSKENDDFKFKSKLETYLAVTEKQTEIIVNNENKSLQQEQLNQKTTYNYVNPETLLAEVQGNKKQSGNTNTYKSTLKVNPNDLLNSVETELNQSFKDKALLKFKQAKSAFVNRNYN